MILQREGRPDEARQTLCAAAEEFVRLDNTAGRADALRQLGLVELFSGRLEEADGIVRQALDAFIERRRPHG